MTQPDSRAERDDARDGASAPEETKPDDGAGSASTDRPSGTSTAEDHTGVDAQDPIDPDSPMLQAGGG